MNSKSVYKVMKESLGRVLEPHGFSCDLSRRSTFYRTVSDNFYHIILPDPGRSFEWFDLKVFAWSKTLEPDGEASFPDSVGIPSDVFCSLSKDGIGARQEKFRFNSEDELRMLISGKVEPLIERFAVPYFDRLPDLLSYYPLIKSRNMKAIASAFVDSPTEAKRLLDAEVLRVRGFESNDQVVLSMVSYLDKLRAMVAERETLS